MFNPDEWIELALDLLSEFGVLFPGVQTIPPHRDPVDGHEVPGSTEDFTILGVVQEYNAYEKAQTSIQSGDVRFVCDNSRALKIGDRIRINGVYWRVEQPNPVIPDGQTIICHRAQMRRVAA